MSWRRSDGFVLLNALVLVLAMTAAAASLMVVSARSHGKIAFQQTAAQALLYLDAGEPLVVNVLQQDHADSPGIDHLGEAWATEGYSVPVDRGRLAGRIRDLQGRFNLNWLSLDDAQAEFRAFQRLVAGLGLPAQLGPAVRQFMAPGGPRNPSAYVNRAVPIRATGGRLSRIGDIRAVAGMTERAFERLRPHLAALPPESALNVNTATAEVLAAMLPGAGPRTAERLLNLRAANPITSVGAFAELISDTMGATAVERVDDARFTVRSDWFGAELEVTLDETVRRRIIVLYRAPNDGNVSTQNHVTQP